MATSQENKIITPTFHHLRINDNVKIWYRSAGKPSSPILLLLHGFPTSSNMFRNLIPLLASKFHVIAPDMPGFGFTEFPSDYQFSFANLAQSIEQFLEILKIRKYYLYVFDYGSPVGFRLALRNPSTIAGIVVQNGNAYDVGIDDRFWAPIKKYWSADQKEPQFLQAFTEFLQEDNNVISQYLGGVEDPGAVDPTNYTLDISLLHRAGQVPIQIKLFHDYKTNIDLYPEFQRFLRNANIPVLVVWGKNDTVFSVEGAEAFRRDVKCLKIVYYQSGHFALETHVAEIASEINEYFYENAIH